MECSREERVAVGVYDDYSGIHTAYDGIPLEHYKISEGEVIVARYKLGEFSCESLQKQHEILKSCFRDNVVLMMPDNLSLKKLSKDDLMKLRNMLEKLMSIKQSDV